MSLEQALAHLRAGRPEFAKRLIDAHLQQDKDDSRAWFLLGACRHALSDLAGAREAFSRSVELDPANLEAHVARISVARAADDAQAALAACEQALDLFPFESKLHYAAALALEDLGRTEEALGRYDRALAIEPAFEDALHNRGLLLARAGRTDEAARSFARCAEIHPGSVRALGALADALLALGDFDGAIAAVDAILRLRPPDASALIRRGLALACKRRLDEAREVLSLALRQYPRDTADFAARVAPGGDLEAVLSPENIFLSRQYLALGRCDWSSWESFVEEMRRAARRPDTALEPAVLFMALHVPLDGQERFAIARHIAARIESRSPALPAPWPRPPSRSRIRIGLLSPDFREHLNAYLDLPLFELLDRTRFEVHAYSLAADDGSAIRARIRTAADGFHDLHGVDDVRAARAIREHDVDILLDVAGHTSGGRFAIVAQRPARVQASYLGFIGSLGSARVDFAIVDRVVAPSPAEWTESLVHLPHTFFLYDFRPLAPRTPLRRQDYGLPEDAFVYCAFHKAEKIGPDSFALWMEVLRRVPRSVLWLRALPDAAIANLRARARADGVAPERLFFALFEGGERYIARHALGDLMLDALHHNAVTSSCDALAAGLPVLTLRGAAPASRACESVLRAAGLPEMVATGRAAFVESAAKLAAQPAVLEALRTRLYERNAPLFDTAGRVRELEACFEQMLGASK